MKHELSSDLPPFLVDAKDAHRIDDLEGGAALAVSFGLFVVPILLFLTWDFVSGHAPLSGFWVGGIVASGAATFGFGTWAIRSRKRRRGDVRIEGLIRFVRERYGSELTSQAAADLLWGRSGAWPDFVVGTDVAGLTVYGTAGDLQLVHDMDRGLRLIRAESGIELLRA